MYKLPVYQIIKSRLEEPRRFIQVVMGPRQVGKSTVVKQVIDDLNIPFQYYSADDVPSTNKDWIYNCWESARFQFKNFSPHPSCLYSILRIVTVERDSDTRHFDTLILIIL